MDASSLFLNRVEQLVTLVRPQTAIDALDIAGRIRQLILDQHSLFQAVNPNKVPVIFHVGVMRPYETGMVFCILEDGLDPDTGRPNRPTVHLDSAGFLAHPVIRHEQDEINVKDVIKYASNAAGGVHWDPSPKPEYERIHKVVTSGFQIGGFPAGIGQLKAIGRVVIKALEPLRNDVTSRHF